MEATAHRLGDALRIGTRVVEVMSIALLIDPTGPILAETLSKELQAAARRRGIEK
jgi:hypothetical protein